MTGNKIRERFLKFFEERPGKEHRRVRSSSLVPANDPTLLFTNAGMNQFKDVFLGLEQRDYKRATTCQKCVRAGGKHNDLENVGFTNRHHTFFEMLGNFSFGDYFKKDAIAFAWELITSPKWFNLPVEKLYFTVFGGADLGKGTNLPPDEEAASLWAETGAPKDRIFEISGLKENFWQMGDTGPCGPCSEIFYDMGPAASDSGHTDCKFPCDCGRYVEIWNLVFMQFDRVSIQRQISPARDFSDHELSKQEHVESGVQLVPLPKPSVDTGMGLERVAAVLQGVISNYETDLFTPLIHRAAELTGASPKDPAKLPSLRIIADHSRATLFLICDGVIPSNEGRGYVLRKIMRRAMHHARLLGQEQPVVLTEMTLAVQKQMEGAYPELRGPIFANALKIVHAEEERFAHTLAIGLKKLDAHLVRWTQDGIAKTRIQAPEGAVHGPYESGFEAFTLYDTFGLPRDFIEDAYRDANVPFPAEGFEKAMEEQRTRAKASWKGAHKEAANPVYAKLAEVYKTEPDFYSGTKTRDARVEAIVTKDGKVSELKRGEEGEVVLDRTAIYSESGGQVADTGKFYDNSESTEVAEVRGAYYPVSGLIAHRVLAKEDLRVGDRVATVADADRRLHDMRNHTATHLVHAALRNILGTHVKQAGSLVAPNHLRFDFSHFAAVDPAEISEIEQQVNEEIRRNLEMRTDIMNIDDALASGALAFFGDKYPESNVRVVTIPDSGYPRGFYSKELCGGTHVVRTGDIGVFKIVGEQSTAAGVRRIEAITGDRGLEEYQRALATIRQVAGMLNSGEEDVLEALERQIASVKALEKQLEELKRKAAGSQAQGLLEGVREVKGVKVLASRVTGVDREAMRQMVDTLRQKLGSGVVVLAAAEDGKVALITGVTKDLQGKLHAGKIVQELAKLVGGSGGGRPDLAEAGGKDTSAVESALSTVYPLIERSL